MNDDKLEDKNHIDDDKEVINFMKFVDDKCLQVNSSKVDKEKEEVSAILEQKPLNDNINKNLKPEANLNKEGIYSLNNMDQLQSSEIINCKNEINNLSNKKSNTIQHDLFEYGTNPFNYTGDFSKFDKYKIDFNDQMTSQSTKLNLQILNKQIKKMAQKDSKKIILKNDQLEVKSKIFNDEVRISKFPGYIFINIYAIERYFGTDADVKSIFVRMQIGNFTFDTCDLKEGSLIKINNLVYLNLTNSNSFDISFYLIKRINVEVIKKCELTVHIDHKFLSRIHNNLIDVKYEWTPYCSKNIFKKFKKFFSTSLVDAHKLHLFFSFISVEEFKIINLPIPMTLMNLCRWLKIRKYSYSNWFSGFCNIKGTIPSICTHLWKRRYIKLYGYRIYIFNEFTKILIGTYEIFNEKKISEKNNKVIFGHETAKIELLFDNNDKYQMFRSVLEILLK